MQNNPGYTTYFNGEGAVQVLQEQTLLEAALTAGIPHAHICGGNAKCSTCRVLIFDGMKRLSGANQKEMPLNSKMNFPPNVRLACQTTLINGPVTLQRIIWDKTDINIYITNNRDSSKKIGEDRELSLFFLDIRNFTSFVETHLAFDVIHIVRKLFLTAQTLIKFHGGRIVETMGDGFYAVFGCERSRYASVRGAIQAGFEILKNLKDLNDQYFIPHFNQKFEIGTGVHFGNVISVEINLGAQHHTIVMGLPVNIAARLQNPTKELKNNLIVSENAYNYYREAMDPHPSALLHLKGIKEPVRAFLIGEAYL